MKKKRKHLDQFYNIKKNTSHRVLIKKIRACYIHDSFRPYIKPHNFKFVLARVEFVLAWVKSVWLSGIL